MEGLAKRPAASLAVGWLTMFVIGTDLFVVSPLLPIIAANYRISATLAGLSVSVFSLTYMVSAPFFGHLADRVGRHRVLVCGLLAFAAANLATAAAPSLIWLLAARIIAGAAAAGVSPSIYALVAGAAPPQRRASWMAFVVSGLLVSLTLGAPIGTWAGASFAWQVVFVALAGLSLLLVVPNSYVWPRAHGASYISAAPLGTFGMVAVARRLMPMVLWSTALYGMYTYLGAGLAGAGYTTDETARTILLYGSGAIFGVLIGGRLADRLGAKLMAMVSLLGLSGCFLLLPLAIHTGLLVGLALALTSAVAQLFFPAQQAGIAADFPNHRAGMMAWNNSALFFGISLGSLLGGQAVGFSGFEADLMLSAAIAMIGSIVVGLVAWAPAGPPQPAGRPV